MLALIFSLVFVHLLSLSWKIHFSGFYIFLVSTTKYFLAARCSTVFSYSSPTVLVCRLVLDKWCKVGIKTKTMS